MKSAPIRLALLSLCCVLAGVAAGPAIAASEAGDRLPTPAGPIELAAVRHGGMLCKATRLELDGRDARLVAARYDVAWLNPAGCGARGGKVRLGAAAKTSDH